MTHHRTLIATQSKHTVGKLLSFFKIFQIVDFIIYTAQFKINRLISNLEWTERFFLGSFLLGMTKLRLPVSSSGRKSGQLPAARQKKSGIHAGLPPNSDRSS